jgi:hypothetical protein
MRCLLRCLLRCRADLERYNIDNALRCYPKTLSSWIAADFANRINDLADFAFSWLVKRLLVRSLHRARVRKLRLPYLLVKGAPATPQYPTWRLRASSAGSIHLAAFSSLYGINSHELGTIDGFGPASFSRRALRLFAM